MHNGKNWVDFLRSPKKIRFLIYEIRNYVCHDFRAEMKIVERLIIN